MSPKRFILVAIVLLAGSVMLEIALLGEVVNLGDTTYHAIHVFLMACLAGSQFALYFYAKKHGLNSRLPLFFGIGACLTGTGDFVNGAISGVEPVSLKLTWALLLFGTGYFLYAVAMWSHNNAVLKRNPTSFSKYRYAIAVPILVVNVAAWFLHVEPNVADFDLLKYGSFVFNATLYVALPTFAVWFFYSSGWSIGGLIVLFGAILVPYSDLILFSSWLGDGDPAVPSFELYAYNWIVYFGGQVMISTFPALAIDGHVDAKAAAAMR